jgi:hypothetical protein
MASTLLVYRKTSDRAGSRCDVPGDPCISGNPYMPFRLEMNVTPVSSSAMFCSVDLGDHRVQGDEAPRAQVGVGLSSTSAHAAAKSLLGAPAAGMVAQPLFITNSRCS